MKKIILLLAIPFLGLAQANKLDEKNGFKTYVFGSTPIEHKDLTLEIEDGPVKLYSLNQTIIKLDSTDFEYIRITFYKDKLSAIALQTKNATGSAFLNSLKENYGQPAKVKGSTANYEWVCSKYRLLYEKNNRSGDATVSFYTASPKNKN